MPIRQANASWIGDLKQGQGRVSVGSGLFEGAYSFTSRFEKGQGTNPEELLGAAHAGCFSMAFAHLLAQNGHPPAKIETDAEVEIVSRDQGFEISRVHLTVRANVPNIDEPQFVSLADQAKQSCPVSRALAGTTITMEASLTTEQL